MTNGVRQRPLGRSAPVAAGPDRLSFSLACPHCDRLVRIAVDGAEGANGGHPEQPEGRLCVVCHEPIVGRARWAVYCSRRCSKRALRRRQRGVPQDLYGRGGGRGPVRLDELTLAEQLAGAVIERAR